MIHTNIQSSILFGILLFSMVFISCSTANKASPSTETVVITIGNLTDQTGPSANAMETINMGLEDLVKYYNTENLIPGVELKVISYDGQYDPSRDIPGYEWLKEKGADVIFTAVASSVVAIKPRLERDQMILFTVAPTHEVLEPPGYIFSMGAPLSEDLGYTLLKWVAENDPDFPQDRPAKIGGAFWAEAYGNTILDGAEEYALSHPEQYEWEGGYLPGFTFIWTTEVEALQNCDYVIPPIPMNTFIEAYRNAGYTAKFLGTHAHDAFLGMVDDANLWDEMDGMYFIRSSEWWTDDSTMVNLMKELLDKNRSDKAKDIRRMGNGYLAGYNFYVMLELIANAIEISGPESFDAQAIFDAAESFTLTIDGVERESLRGTERNSINYLTMYELRADEEDLFRVEPKWNPVVTIP